jgi:hypothetical protein
MKIQLVSDLHLDHDADGGRKFLADTFNQDFLDTTLVVAGDWGSSFNLELSERFFDAVCRRYAKVIAVCGNHEFWNYPLGTNRDADDMRMEYRMLRLKLKRKKRDLGIITSGADLDNGVYAGTMWYPTAPPGVPRVFSDHTYIHCNTASTSNWISSQHSEFLNGLKGLIEPPKLIITHHMPSVRSSDPKFLGWPNNHYFVTPMEDYILEAKPKLWLHGHGHYAVDYMLGETRVVCNPRGYPGERVGTYRPKEIEL